MSLRSYRDGAGDDVTKKQADAESLRKKIEARAYELWERDGRPHGRQDEHWRLAEVEILSLTKAKPPAGKKTKAEPKAKPAAKTKKSAKPKKA